MIDQRFIDEQQQKYLESKAVGRCIQIGSGMRIISGAVNLDPNPERWPGFRDMGDIGKDELFVAGYGQVLPFTDLTFESLVSSHVLPVFADINAALREMARVLVIGGRMAHVVPDLRYAPSREGSRYRFEKQYSGWYGPDDFRNSLNGLDDVLIVAKLECFREFNWSFMFEAVRV